MLKFAVNMSQITKLLINISRIQIIRNYSQATPGPIKVALCGAAGRSGQATALILKTCPLIDELAVYDIARTNGMAMELNHIDTNCKVMPKGKLRDALENAQIVAIVASCAMQSEERVTELFKKNAIIVHEIITGVAQYCPKASIAIATNPINSMVPLASELMIKHRVYDEKHIFGVNTFNVMRTNSIVAEFQGLCREDVHVPVVGGTSGRTIVPILSQMRPQSYFSHDDLLRLVELIQTSCEYKGRKIKTTCLSCALAVSRFVISLVRAMKGEERIVETAYVRSKAYPNSNYLVSPIELGIHGLQKNLGLPRMSEYEKCLLHSAVTEMSKEINAGEDFVGLKATQKRMDALSVCNLNPCK